MRPAWTTCLALLLGAAGVGPGAVDIISSLPADNAAVTVEAARTLYLVFDDRLVFDVDLGTNGHRIRLIDGDTGAGVDLSGSALISNAPDSGTLILPLAAGILLPARSYHVAIDAGALRSFDSGVNYAGTTATTWNFVTIAGVADPDPRPTALQAAISAVLLDRTGIGSTRLSGEDPDAGLTADQVLFEVVTTPGFGRLLLRDVVLGPGDRFNQQDLDLADLDYENSVASPTNLDHAALKVVNGVDGSSSSTFWLMFNIGGAGSDVPVISPATSTVTYVEADPIERSTDPVSYPAIAPASGVAVSDLGAFANAAAVLDIGYADTVRLHGEYDVLFFDPAALGGLTISGTDISDGNGTVGIIQSDGTAGSALTVLCRDNGATSSAQMIDHLETLLGALRFRHDSGRFAAGSARNLQVVIDDGVDGVRTAVWQVVVQATDSRPRPPLLVETGLGSPIRVDDLGFSGTFRIQDPEWAAVDLILDLSQPLSDKSDFRVLTTELDADSGVTTITWRYLPFAGASGSDTVYVVASDGVRQRSFPIVFAILSSDLRTTPWPLGDPHLLVRPSPTTTTELAIPFNTTGVFLDWVVQGALPEGVVLSAPASDEIRIVWPARAGDGALVPHAFDLIVDDGNAVTRVPVTIVEDRRPSG